MGKVTELEMQVMRLIEAEKGNWRSNMLSWQYLTHCQEKTAEAALEAILEEEGNETEDRRCRRAGHLRTAGR